MLKLLKLLSFFILINKYMFAYDFPIIDAHSQVDHKVDLNKIIKLMDKAGVSKTILSARGKLKANKLLEFSNNNESRIVPAIRTKGNHYIEDTEKYYRILSKQNNMNGFGAIAEVILWHAKKGNKAPEVIVFPEDNRVLIALEVAKNKNWPFIIHIEFSAIGNDKIIFMNKFKKFLFENPDTVFVLNHIGQLNTNEVNSLINEFPNINFITAHTNPIVLNRSSQPWTNMFDGNIFTGYKLNNNWKELIIKYPNRFILGFDNVFPEHWGDLYLDQVSLWKETLNKLPLNVAKKVAFENAQRLWHIK